MVNMSFAIPHFFEEMANDDLLFADIERVIATGRIRRRFTRDSRGARYEVVGSTSDERGCSHLPDQRDWQAVIHNHLCVRVETMRNHKSTYNYGKCHVCGEQMEERKINQDFWIKGKLIVIESVPAGVCPQCGEKIVKADVGRHLASLIQNMGRLPKRKTISVPVVRYAKEVA
jgi:YgiT-type zinc finger domain-containing protein